MLKAQKLKENQQARHDARHLSENRSAIVNMKQASIINAYNESLARERQRIKEEDIRSTKKIVALTIRVLQVDNSLLDFRLR